MESIKLLSGSIVNCFKATIGYNRKQFEKRITFITHPLTDY